MEKKSKFSEFLTKFGEIRLAQIWSLLKKPFNFCWKLGLIIFGVCMLLAVYIWIKQAAGCVYYDSMDETLSIDVEIRYFSNNRCATYDSVTGKRLSPKLLWISACPQRDSLTVFCDKHGRRGFLNVNTGKVVIEGQYRHAWHFSEGLAAVVDDNGKVGFINYDNEMVIPAVYEYVPSHDYVFVNGTHTTLSLSLYVYDEQGELMASSYPVDVQIVRNKLTVVKGEFLTSKASGGVSISPGYEGKDYDIFIQ